MTTQPIKRRTKLVPMLAIIILSVCSAGCADKVSDEDIEEQKQTVTDEQDKLDALIEREEVENKIESKLTALEQEVGQLEEQAENVKGDEEVQLRGEIAKLKTKHKHAEDRLKELRAASGDQWAKLKIKTEAAWKDVSDSVKEKVKHWQERSAKDETGNVSDDDVGESIPIELDASK